MPRIAKISVKLVIVFTKVLFQFKIFNFFLQDINRVKKIQCDMLASAMVDPKAKQVNSNKTYFSLVG
jgi:hypothetical protein